LEIEKAIPLGQVLDKDRRPRTVCNENALNHCVRDGWRARKLHPLESAVK
jgi:hypothetical protein